MSMFDWYMWEEECGRCGWFGKWARLSTPRDGPREVICRVCLLKEEVEAAEAELHRLRVDLLSAVASRG